MNASSMTLQRILSLAIVAWLSAGPIGMECRLWAETSSVVSGVPKPIPRTRPEMKRMLEELKSRQPRLPLPRGSEPIREATSSVPSETPRSIVNNSRMRSRYLPESWHARSFRTDPEMTVDYALKTRLFWIVSRLNNCHYCLGHQEHKLLAAGMREDDIAALDSRWVAFPASEQAAMELAVKLTVAPALIGDADFQRLRLHWHDAQIVEIIHSVASNNATNRWTDALGIPQDQVFRDHAITLDTPTSPEYTTCESSVLANQPTQSLSRLTIEEIHRELSDPSYAPRVPRVPSSALVEDAPSNAADKANAHPAWLAALAPFPQTAAAMQQQWEAVGKDGKLPAQYKWELRWIVARELQAKYAMSVVWQKLRADGRTWDDMVALETDEASVAGVTAARQFAKKLTLTPQQMSDADIVELQKHFSDAEVAETVYVVCQANWFARFTEALQLPLER